MSKRKVNYKEGDVVKRKLEWLTSGQWDFDEEDRFIIEKFSGGQTFCKT